MRTNESLDEKVTYTFKLFGFFFQFLFAFPFSLFVIFFLAVDDPVLALLPVHGLPRKHHRDGQFLPARPPSS